MKVLWRDTRARFAEPQGSWRYQPRFLLVLLAFLTDRNRMIRSDVSCSYSQTDKELRRENWTRMTVVTLMTAQVMH